MTLKKVLVIDHSGQTRLTITPNEGEFLRAITDSGREFVEVYDNKQIDERYPLPKAKHVLIGFQVYCEYG